MSGPFKLLLIGDSDSQLLACEALCRFPSDLNIQVTINAIQREGTPDSILQRAAALGDLWRLDMGHRRCDRAPSAVHAHTRIAPVVGSP